MPPIDCARCCWVIFCISIKKTTQNTRLHHRHTENQCANSTALMLPFTITKCRRQFPVARRDSGNWKGGNNEGRLEGWPKKMNEAGVSRSFVKSGRWQNTEQGEGRAMTLTVAEMKLKRTEVGNRILGALCELRLTLVTVLLLLLY